MKRFLITIISVLILFGLFVWSYPIIKNRYFSENKSIIKVAPPENGDQSIADSLKNIGQQSDDESPENENNAVMTPAENVPEQPSLTNITPIDCDSGCSAFANDPKYLKYCQEVCGIAPAENDSGCESKAGLEKDYCLKSLAVSRKDFLICDQIEDGSMKKTCQNRITQDIIENK